MKRSLLRTPIAAVLAAVIMHASVLTVQADAPFAVEVIDADGFVGTGISMAIDKQDHPHAVYWDIGNFWLVYATRSGGVWSTEIIQASGFTGNETSIAVAANGDIYVSYDVFTLTTQILRMAVRSGGTWTTETVDSTANNLGRYNSIALDAQGRPHISYQDVTNEDLKYALKNGAWATQVLDANAGTGYNTSIAINSQTGAVIGYWNSSIDDLWTAYQVNGVWTIGPVIGQGDVGDGVDLALDRRGVSHFSYFDRTNFEMQYKIRESGNPPAEVVATGVFGSNGWSSLALDATGVPHIAFRHLLMTYAVKRGSTWEVQTLSDVFSESSYHEMVLDSEGNPMIAYYDASNGDAKLADTSVRLTAPAGGDNWPVGALRTVSWNGTGVVDVLLSTDGGQTFEEIAHNVDSGPMSGSTEIRVPHAPSRFCVIRIERDEPVEYYSSSDVDSFFTIETNIALLNFTISLPSAGQGLVLSWQTDPAPEDLGGYRVERKRGQDAWTTVASLIGDVSYNDVDGKQGDRYRLYAVNNLGSEFLLGESSSGPLLSPTLSAYPVPYRSGDLTVTFGTAGGLGGGSAQTKVAIYNVAGRLVSQLVNRSFDAGVQTVTWDGRGKDGQLVSSGVYFLKATSAGVTQSRKLVIAR